MHHLSVVSFSTENCPTVLLFAYILLVSFSLQQMTMIKAQAGVKNNLRRLNKSIIQNGSNHIVHVVVFALICFFVVYLWSKMSRKWGVREWSGCPAWLKDFWLQGSFHPLDHPHDMPDSVVKNSSMFEVYG